MKKEIKLIALFVIFGISVITAQNRGLQLQTEYFIDNVNRNNSPSYYDESNPDNYNGNPYYKESFLLGKIYLENDLLDNNVLLRYNAVADEIEFKASSDTKDIKALVKTKALYAIIDGETFVFIPGNGYFIALQDGKNISLLKKVAKKYFPPREATSTYDKGSKAKFADKHSYFLYTKDGVLKEFPKSKKKKLSIFGESEKNVAKYIKKNKLDINSEKDLIQIFQYLNTL